MSVSIRTTILTAALFIGGAAGASALAIGDAMPSRDVKMRSVTGKDVTLAGVAGPKGTLVIFSCNHCPWVQAWEERIVALGNEYGKRGIGVVAVNANDPAEYPDDDFSAMQERARQRGYAFDYAVDATSDVARAFGATKTPEAFIFNAAGTLVYHGTVDDNAKDAAKVEQRYLRDALEAVATGKPVALAETKALGCSIKFRAAK